MPEDDNELTEEGEKAIKTVAKGGGIVFVGLLLSRFLGYLYRLVVGRYLGPDQYGVISLGMAVVGFAVPVALLGLYQGVKRYASYYNGKGEKEKVKGTILSTFKIITPLSMAMAILVFLLSDFLAIRVLSEPAASIVFKIFAVSIPFQVLLKGTTGIIESFKAMKYSVVARYITRNTSKIVLTVTLLFLGFEILGAASAYALSYVLAFILALYYLIRKVFPEIVSKLPSVPNYRELLSFSWPLLFTAILGSVMGWTDTFMLGYFLDSTQVGIYNAALPTAILLTTFLVAIRKIIFPVMSELISKNKMKEPENIYQVSTKWIISITFPLFLMLVLFSRQILTFLFGSEYAAGYLVLSVLATAQFIRTSVGSAGSVLKSHGRTKLLLADTTASAILNVVLNLLLIQKYGLVGAAIATAFSIVFINLLVLVENKLLFDIQPYRPSIYKPIVSAILSATITYYIFQTLFTPVTDLLFVPAFVVFIALYSFIFLTFGGLDNEDVLVLKAVERKTGIKIKWLRDLIKRFS